MGQVAGFVIDPQSHSIVAVTLKNPAGDTVLWAALSAFGVDAVTVPGAEVIHDANDAVAALAGRGHRLFGKRVLNTDGEDLGAVTDAEFDPATGRSPTATRERHGPWRAPDRHRVLRCHRARRLLTGLRAALQRDHRGLARMRPLEGGPDISCRDDDLEG